MKVTTETAPIESDILNGNGGFNTALDIEDPEEFTEESGEDSVINSDLERLKEIQRKLEAEKERIKAERAEQKLPGRAKKSPYQRELEKEEKKLKKILGGAVRYEEDPEREQTYVPVDSLTTETIVNAVDSFLQYSLANRHPEPEKLPFSKQEKKMIKEPLEAVMMEVGAEMTPGTALVIACATVIGPRVLPVVLPWIMEKVESLKNS